MRRSRLLYGLIVSALLNLGVVGAAGYQAHGAEAARMRAIWPTNSTSTQRSAAAGTRLEESFLRELDAGWRDIAAASRAAHSRSLR